VIKIPKKGKIDETAKELVKEMSKPRKEKKNITGSSRENQVFETQTNGLVDCYGRTFCPDLHINKKGKPLVSSRSGLLRCKKGKAPSISEICDISDIFEKQRQKKELANEKDLSNEAVLSSDDTAQNQTLGSASAEIVFTVGMAAGGEDFIPSKQERVYMSSAFTQYYQSKGMKDLPPGFILASALLSYIAPRMNKPKTQTKLKKLYIYLKSKLTKTKDFVVSKKAVNQ